MKILVIDDSQDHLLAAKQLLGGDNELMLCGSHDEAVELLNHQFDEPRKTLLQQEYEASGMAWREAYRKAAQETLLPYWDAVLCDLLMPAGRRTQGNSGLKLSGTEMPVGWSLALFAAQQGAKYVAVVTDMNHHAHPASAMLDDLKFQIMKINDSSALFTNDCGHYAITGTDHQCPHCGGSGKSQRRNWQTGEGEEVKCYYCDGTAVMRKHGKDWQKILRFLVSGKLKDDDGAG